MTESLSKAFELKTFMTQARRHFHQHPELSGKEFETTKYIKNCLAEIGIETINDSFTTGLTAIIQGTKEGVCKTIAIRADIDALPIIEQTGVEYSSKIEGVMHACGHDGHTACLLGVASLLHTNRDNFSSKVILIFQPAEEGLGGAKGMLESGIFENDKPDEIIALHAYPSIPTGKIGIMPQKAMASSDSFQVKIIGKGGHGARPAESINPILAGVMAVSGISNIVSNQIPTFDSVVISVCTIQAGTASNIIPEEASFSGTVRCLENSNRQVVKEAIERIVSGISESFCCKYEYIYKEGANSLTNSPKVMENIVNAAKNSIGEDSIEFLETPSMGSEDFSDFITAVGGCGAMFRLGTGTDSLHKATLHNDKFDFNDDALPYGAAVMYQYILNR